MLKGINDRSFDSKLHIHVIIPFGKNYGWVYQDNLYFTFGQCSYLLALAFAKIHTEMFLLKIKNKPPDNK